MCSDAVRAMRCEAIIAAFTTWMFLSYRAYSLAKAYGFEELFGLDRVVLAYDVWDQFEGVDLVEIVLFLRVLQQATCNHVEG
jgi:hypothetical protein